MKKRLNWNKSTNLYLYFILSLSAILFNSCSHGSLLSTHDGNKYRYTYKIISPTENDKMTYRDSALYVQFRFDDAALRFQLQNIYSTRLSIQWSKVSLGVGEVYSLVRNSKTLYTASKEGESEMTVPPKGYFRDFVLPQENVLSKDGYNEKDLLPTVDHGSDEDRQKIMANRGKIVSLILPIHLGTESKLYTFQFRVVSVDQIPWDKATTPKRPAAPVQITETKSAPVDPYFILGGIGVVAGYLLFTHLTH